MTTHELEVRVGKTFSPPVLVCAVPASFEVFLDFKSPSTGDLLNGRKSPAPVAHVPPSGQIP